MKLANLWKRMKESIYYPHDILDWFLLVVALIGIIQSVYVVITTLLHDRS